MTVTASNFERKANDLYETEAWATRALIRRFPVDGLFVWEPAAGNHAIVDVLLGSGAKVIYSDIVTYGRDNGPPIDFLNNSFFNPEFLEGIITNPPYGKGNREAVRFCEVALHKCKGLVAMLLTAKFDFGKTRHHLFRDNPRFAAKINLVDRISWAGNGETGTEDHAWYVWTAEGNSPPVIYYEGKAE